MDRSAEELLMKKQCVWRGRRARVLMATLADLCFAFLVDLNLEKEARKDHGNRHEEAQTNDVDNKDETKRPQTM